MMCAPALAEAISAAVRYAAERDVSELDSLVAEAKRAAAEGDYLPQMVLADYLEENPHLTHDDASVQVLRHADGPVIVADHPASGRKVAFRGPTPTPVQIADRLFRSEHGQPPSYLNEAIGHVDEMSPAQIERVIGQFRDGIVHVEHGPRGVYVVSRFGGDRLLLNSRRRGGGHRLSLLHPHGAELVAAGEEEPLVAAAREKAWRPTARPIRPQLWQHSPTDVKFS